MHVMRGSNHSIDLIGPIKSRHFHFHRKAVFTIILLNRLYDAVLREKNIVLESV